MLRLRTRPHPAGARRGERSSRCCSRLAADGFLGGILQQTASTRFRASRLTKEVPAPS